MRTRIGWGIFVILTVTLCCKVTAGALPDNGSRDEGVKSRIAPDDIAITPANHPALFRELTDMTDQWKTVIQNRDTEGLVSFASDHYRTPVRKKLADPNSDIYKMFFDKNGPVFGFFRRIPSPRLALIGHQRGIGNQGMKEIYGATVCFYDGSNVHASTNREILEMLDREITQPYDILCLYFSRDGHKWSPNFEFDTEN